MLKKIFDKNKVSVHDWHFVDYQRLQMIELKNDNLAKFIAEWDYCLLHSTCNFSEQHREECFLRQIKKSSALKGLLDNYEYHTYFYGGQKSYAMLYGLVERQLEKMRYDKSRADVLNLGKNFQALAATTVPKGKCHNWTKFGKYQLGVT